MDRRGAERRTPQQVAEQAPRSTNDQVDVEQIMREIRSRVSQRHGIELTPQQIQDLAARRLEAILDPRNVNPTLFEQLRKGAAAPPEPAPQTAKGELSITENAIYEGSGAVRFFRRLLNPLLKLLFNPSPLIAALQTQARINDDSAARAAERERRQTEWNALHYQVLQRLVTEVSRNSLEMQALVSRVEALAARVDFNDRRVRALESAPAPARSQRPHEAPPQQPAPAPVENVAVEPATGQSLPAATAAGPPDGQRRRRRRRRGRRGSTPFVEAAGAAAAGMAGTPDNGTDGDDDEEMPEGVETAEPTVSVVPMSVEPMSPEPVSVEPVSVEPEPPSFAAEPAPTGVLPQPASPAWPEPAPPPEAEPVPAPPGDRSGPDTTES